MAQTLTEIRSMLVEAGLAPQKMFGQNFLIDHNLLRSIVETSGVGAGDAVLEIGPGTGTLTDELLAVGAKVLAVEIDRGLAALLERRYAGRDDFELLNCDVLASKHKICPDVLAAANQMSGTNVHIVANLPYNIATSLIVESLLLSAAAARGQQPGLACGGMTVTVQHELAVRLAAKAGDEAYGPASVLVSLLGEPRLGKRLPAQAFWPRPNVTSQVLRIDIRPADVDLVPDAWAVQKVVTTAFTQRRKKIGSIARWRGLPWPPERFTEAVIAAGIDPNVRPERITPEQYARLAKHLGHPDEV